MCKWKIKYKEVIWVFVLSRLIILLTSVISIFVLPQFIPELRRQIALSAPYSSDIYTLRVLLNSWFRWDVKAYVNISFHGYKHTPDTAFFPLWPLIQHFGGLLLGGHFPNSYYIAGLLLANLCFFFALVLLYQLLSEDFDPALARRALIYLTFAPYAIFFFAGYTESLFLLLCIAFFLFLRRGKPMDWWLAGSLGFLAALTRSLGLLLAVPFFVMYIRHFWIPPQRDKHSLRLKLNALAPILLLPAATLSYMLYLSYTKGDPFLFKTEEETVWHRHFTLPWDIYSLMTKVFTTLLSSLSLDRLSFTSIEFIGLNILYSFFALLPLGILVLGWKRIPIHYALFSLTYLIFVLSTIADASIPFYSHPRYMIILYPISVIFAIWGKHPRLHRWFITISLVLFVINTISFTTGLWTS